MHVAIAPTARGSGPLPPLMARRFRHARETTRTPRPRAGACEVRLATDARTRDDAYALRYRSYLSSGHVAERADRRFRDRYDDTGSSHTMVAYRGGIAVGSVRACLIERDGGTEAPCLDAFPHETGALLAALPPSPGSIAAVEVNRLVRDPSATDDPGLVFLLCRLAGLLAMRLDAAMTLSCVRRHHEPFYRRLRFAHAGEARPYPGLTCPMQLMVCLRADYGAARRVLAAMDPGRPDVAACDGLLAGRTVTIPWHPGASSGLIGAEVKV